MQVNWITTEIDDQNGTRGSDMDGNKYFSPPSGETVYCTTPDGRKGCGWTAAQALESALSEPPISGDDCTKELLPCPFCGSSITHRFFEPNGLGDYEPQHNFICDGCEALVVLTDISLEKAIAVYNKRPD